MKNREVFLLINIIVILTGFYMLLVKTIWVELGPNNIFQVSVVSDGITLILMGIAMVIVSSREWDSEKRIK